MLQPGVSDEPGSHLTSSLTERQRRDGSASAAFHHMMEFHKAHPGHAYDPI